MSMRRCVLIASAQIRDYEKIKSHLRTDDFFVCCDGGLYHMEQLRLQPDYIVGDFDSYLSDLPADIPIERLPCVKDDTDTVAAAKLMLKKGFSEFLLIGFTGQRLDHTLANIGVLLMLHDHHVKAKMIDDYGEMYIADQTPILLNKGCCSFFSLMSVDGPFGGVTISGAKYPLNNAAVTPSYQYAISNEITEEQCRITIGQGRALLLKIQESCNL